MSRLRWRESLYSRAFLLTLVGCASLLGAIGVQSYVMVNATVDRLLQERISLARTTGNYLEQIFHHDLSHLSDVALAELIKPQTPESLDQLRNAIGVVYSSTIFQEGAFVLDRSGKMIASVPEANFKFLYNLVNMRGLIQESLQSPEHAAVSPLVTMTAPDRRILVLLNAIFDRENHLQGFMGGLLHPASNNLLAPFQNTSPGAQSTMELVDREGTVVASTQAQGLFVTADHGSVIADAITKKKDLHGRCHACHLGPERTSKIHREQEVLAFSALRNLPLGVAVRQSEKEALAPAFSLQWKMWVLGFGFVSLFLFFTAISVHSVVAPVRRLTEAVEAMEVSELKTELPSLGQSEVGILSRALNSLRTRVLGNMTELAQKELALQEEFRQTQEHLMVLQNIAAMSTSAPNVTTLLQGSLQQMLKILGYAGGVFRFQHGISRVVAAEKLKEETVPWAKLEAGAVRGDRVFVRTESPYLYFELSPAGQMQLQGVFLIADELSEHTPELRRMESLVHQILISIANKLLHEEQALRHRQSREFLQRVLAAQEDERKRIARELHDTLAQELAAHRLDIERVTGRVKTEGASPVLLKDLKQIEAKAHDMIVILRQMLLDLRPSILDTMGFHPALQWYLERLKSDHGIHAELSLEGEELRLNSDKEINLFRIFQEGMANLIRHADASHWFVTLTYSKDEVELVMEDDGKGFDPEAREALNEQQVLRREGGLGLRGMRERAELLGGQMEIQSTPDEGTVIRVRIPV